MRSPAGVNLLPTQRPFTGLENFAILLECRDYTDLQTCRTDIFWRSIANTVKFSLIQVALMVFFSLVTALVLNRKIIGRGFWRGVFFYPVLLSPVVVALIWKWLLQSQGVFNAGLVAMGASPMDWLLDRHWAFFSGGGGVDLGPHGFLHAHPAGRPAGHPEGRLRSRRDGRRAAVARAQAHHACRCSCPT